MEPRYERNIPALSEAECLILRDKKALVVGCGGLGGHIIDQLARIGVGFLRVVDGDVFEETNLNRQLLSEVPLLGTAKAAAAAERIRRVNPGVSVQAVEAFLTEENVDALLDGCDVVLDALDNIPSRKILAAACADAGEEGQRHAQNQSAGTAHDQKAQGCVDPVIPVAADQRRNQRGGCGDGYHGGGVNPCEAGDKPVDFGLACSGSGVHKLLVEHQVKNNARNVANGVNAEAVDSAGDIFAVGVGDVLGNSGVLGVEVNTVARDLSIPT